MALLSKLATPGSLLLGLALLVYSILRATLVSYNNDEALTFLYHARSSVVDIISYKSTILPSNNHLLNSLFMKASAYFFGESEFALRLPNVLAHVLYLAMCLLIVRRYVPSSLGLPAFALLTLNPYALEFFSLSRGYGLALAFMMVSLFFLLRYVECSDSTPRSVFLSSLFAGLAVTASIPFATFYVAVALLLGLTILLRCKVLAPNAGQIKGRFARAARDSAPLVLCTVLMAVVMVPAVLRLRQADHFITGGQSGFWDDTVMSLVAGSLYGQTYADAVRPLLGALIAVVFGLNVLLFLHDSGLRHERSRRSTLVLVVVPLTAMIAAVSIVLHQSFGVNYLKGRIGVMFIPLCSLLLINAAAYLVTLSRPRVLRGAGVTLLAVAALAASFHALRTFNVSHSMVLRGNASTKQAIDDLVAHYAASYGQTRGYEVKVGISANFKPVITYYTIVRDLEWLEVHEFTTLKEDYDYYYYNPDDGLVLDRKNLIRLAVYPITGARLSTKVPD